MEKSKMKKKEKSRRKLRKVDLESKTKSTTSKKVKIMKNFCEKLKKTKKFLLKSLELEAGGVEKIGEDRGWSSRKPGGSLRPSW